MNSSLHEKHLESGEEWLARGRRRSRFYIEKSPIGTRGGGGSLVPVEDTNWD
jgi:hypothetical protein